MFLFFRMISSAIVSPAKSTFPAFWTTEDVLVGVGVGIGVKVTLFQELDQRKGTLLLATRLASNLAGTK